MKSRNILRHKDESKDGEVNRLKKAVRRLESDKKKLLSELKTLEEAFQHNIKFLKGKTDNLSVEELVEAAKKQMSLRETEIDKDQKFDDLEKKWKCYKENCGGIFKLIIFNNRQGKQYFRKCSNPMCTNRTKPQVYNEKVEGIR